MIHLKTTFNHSALLLLILIKGIQQINWTDIIEFEVAISEADL